MGNTGTRRVIALLLVSGLSACGGDEPIAQPAPETSPTTALSTPTPSVTQSLDECDPDVATELSEGWESHAAQSGDYVFSYPAGWKDESGDIGFNADDLLAPETLSELGLTNEEARGEVVLEEATGDNLGAYQFAGATSPTQLIYDRQEALYSQLDFIEVVATDLSACPDGSVALGLDFAAQVQGEGTRYQRLWFVSREGTVYGIFMDAQEQASLDVIDEVLRTWDWTS